MVNVSNKHRLSSQVAFLTKVPLFADIGDEDLETLARDFRVKEYQQNTILFRQGDRNREFYVIMRGRVRIFKVSPSGAETSITILTRGNILGELAAVDGQPRSASAKTIGVCTLLVMSHDKFLFHMRALPDLAISMTRLLANKLRWTAAYAETIAQFDAPGRLLHMLLLYNELFGVEEEPGKRYVLDLSLNQTDLATLVSTRREWVNRLLREWHRQGLIQYEAGKIIILDLAKLKAERDNRIQLNDDDDNG